MSILNFRICRLTYFKIKYNVLYTFISNGSAKIYRQLIDRYRIIVVQSSPVLSNTVTTSHL